jgi:membrane protease YdiL (CAAX protease family)
LFTLSGRSDELDNPAGVAYLLVAAAGYTAMAAVLLRRLPRLACGPLAEGVGLRPLRRGDLVVAITGFAAVCVLRLGAYGYLVLIGQPGHVQAGLGGFHADSTAAIALTLLVGTTIAPFSEELLFRGTIYRAIAQRLPDGRAAIASGLVFGVARFDLVLLPFFTAYGAVLALAYRRTGDLLVPVLIRAAFDGLAYGLLLWLDFAHVSG